MVQDDPTTTGFQRAISNDFSVSCSSHTPPLPIPPNPTHLTLLAPLASFPFHTACAILYIIEMESQSSLMFLFPIWLMILKTLEKKRFTGHLCFFWEPSVRLICCLCNSYSYLGKLIINPLFPHVQLLNFLYSVALETIFFGIQNHEIFLWSCQFGEFLSLLLGSFSETCCFCLYLEMFYLCFPLVVWNLKILY